MQLFNKRKMVVKCYHLNIVKATMSNEIYRLCALYLQSFYFGVNTPIQN